MAPRSITTLRLGVPGVGILGRVAGGKGPAQLLQATDLFKLGVQPSAYPAISAKVASKWASPISITWTAAGDVTGTVSFDGSANVSTALTLQATGVVAGSYTLGSFTVDAKGRLTAAASGVPPTIYGPLMNGDTAPSGVIVSPDGSAILVPL